MCMFMYVVYTERLEVHSKKKKKALFGKSLQRRKNIQREKRVGKMIDPHFYCFSSENVYNVKLVLIPKMS